MKWRVLYDIAGNGRTDFTPFLYVAGAMLMLALLFQLRAHRRRQTSGSAKVIAIFATLIGGLGYGINTWDQQRLIGRLSGGDYLIAEGLIANHQLWEQELARGKDSRRRYQRWEIVYVAGIAFIWSPGAQEPAFTNAQQPPIDIRDGMPVRISYVEDVAGEAHQRRILRWEVAEPDTGLQSSFTPPP